MMDFLFQMNLRVSALSVLLVGSAVVAMVAAAAQSRNNDNRNKRQSRGGGAEHCDPAFCRIPVSRIFTLLLALILGGKLSTPQSLWAKIDGRAAAHFVYL